MKKVFVTIRFTIALALIAIFGQSFTTATPSVNFPGNGDVMLTQGTPVMLRLNQNINSDNVEVGAIIEFEVANPVIAEGQEVVPQGTIAEGEVTFIKRNDDCATCASEFQSIEIRVDKIKAIDGKFIRLTGKPLTIRGKCPKCPVQVSQGVRLSANVQSNTRIKVK